MRNTLLLLFLTINSLSFSQDYKNLVDEMNQLSNRQLISVVKGDSLSTIKLRLTKNLLLKFDDYSASLLNDLTNIEFKRLTEATVANKLELNEGETPYHYIARKFDMEILDLLPDTYSVNTGDGYKNKPIYLAIAVQNLIEIVEAFIAHGADINITDENGTNLLHTATTHSNITLINLFLKKGFSINQKNKLGMAPVHIASQIYYNENIIKHVLSKGAKIDTMQFLNERDNKYNKRFNKKYYSTIMHEAARNNWVSVLKKGVEQGIDVNLKISKGENTRGSTLLFYATKSKSVDAIRYLVEQGADVNAHTIWSKTPLVEAIISEDKESFDALMTLETDVNFNFPIVHALQTNDPHFARAILLHKSYFAPNSKEGYDKYLEYFKPFNNHSSPESYNDFMSKYKYSPLHSSAMRGWADICELIVNQGIEEIDVRGGQEQNTPLQEVVKGSLDYDIAKTLLKLGANPKIKNVKGQDSFDIAKENKDKEMIKILKN